MATDAFFDALVEHGLIIPDGVAGVFGRGAVFEEVLARFDDYICRGASHDDAQECQFPPVIDRRILDRVDYLESFPHLCGSVHSFFGDARQAEALAERSRKRQSWGELLAETRVVLTPAACYPLYPTLAGTLPASGRLVKLVGWVYRHEPSDEPTRMQSFRVREFIRVGTPEQALTWRDMWRVRGEALLADLALPTTSDVASDPFFGRGGKFMAASQREQKAKFEFLIPVISREQPTAVGSVNLHMDHFGGAFAIRTEDGAVAHSACVGFGLERCVMALFRCHGFRPDEWPAGVRRRLWPG